MPKHLIFIRHGETPHNSAGKFISWRTDPSLSKVGKAHAREVGTRLLGLRINAIYTSDMRRTVETATIIGKIVNVVPTPTELLRERDLGIFDNHTFHEIREKWPHHAAKFVDHADIHWKGHEGESLHEVHLRFRALHNQLKQSHRDQTVLLVTHGGYTHTILRDYFGFFPRESFADIAHNSITIVDRVGDTHTLTTYNQTKNEK